MPNAQCLLLEMEDRRLEAVEFIGVQRVDRSEFAMFNDPLTGTTFCVHRGEKLGEALNRVPERYAESTRREARGKSR